MLKYISVLRQNTSVIAATLAVLASLSSSAIGSEVFKIETEIEENQIKFIIDNRSIFQENVSDYQGHDTLSDNDVLVGKRSAIVRLGWKNDMFLIVAYRRSGSSVCEKILYVQLRDGSDIGITYVGNEGGRELYGIRFGRSGDLYNVYGVRFSDFKFVFDPSALRTGNNRNANTVINSGDYGAHFIFDRGCR